ncbi:small ribosomal subunit Rsm22 family protein [Allorhizobium sonneratiae]|uniref:small ribosomal subunit Rsm22 family protein n=1 Tax=Allorhizobium sonneratiae TaxID=2934936 RepID=UPI00237CB10E|nr:small ribosomal subunit Rsm22 family protein [Allorhizobium sonneratiae]
MRASERLTRRYRGEVRDGHLHIDSELAALAYLAARLPATYAAARAAMEMVHNVHPDFQPKSLIDLGSGPGTALFAAADCWPSLNTATMIEASDAIRRIGEGLSSALSLESNWQKGDVLRQLAPLPAADLVTLAYVLDELPLDAVEKTALKLWQLTREALILIEPGTPAGWQRIVAARQVLLEAGAHIIAPCPHHAACPIIPPDWCHFSRRVQRSRLHRQVKQGEVPYEDEKYIFIAMSRQPVPAAPPPRILAPVKLSSGLARLKLCRLDGTAGETTITRRDGSLFKAARRADWGDGLNLSPEDKA